jgi:LPXTG-motif cell wall-anchored protein
MWAIVAAGEDPGGVEFKYQAQDGHSALDKLRAFQNEGGAFRWQDAFPDDNFASTVQAVVALELKTLPFAWMDVGGTSAEAQAGPPTALPETGASAWISILALLGSGVALTGVGLALRKRS